MLAIKHFSETPCSLERRPRPDAQFLLAFPGVRLDFAYMPYYDFTCRDCQTITSVKASIEEKERGLEVTCEKCGSKNTEQAFLSVAVGSGRSGSRDSAPIGPCGHACNCAHG